MLHDNLSPSDWHIRPQYALVEFSVYKIHSASGSHLVCILTYYPLFFGYSWHYKVPKTRLQVLVNRFLTNTKALLPRLLTECRQVLRKEIENLILFGSKVLPQITGWLCRARFPFPHQKLIDTAIPR